MADQSDKVAAEIQKDRARFDTMSDQELADALNIKDQSRTRKSLSTGDLHKLIDQDEFSALAADVKADLRDLYALGTVDLSKGERARTLMEAAFPAGSITRGALIAALTKTVSLADKAEIREVGRGWVINARRQLGVYTTKDQSSLTEMGRV